jgi:hypothetical protein
MTIARLTVLCALTASAAALVLAAPAVAAAPLSAADRQEISAAVDTFVNHAVRRSNVGASYAVVTPNMRGGMTLKQWSRGSLPVNPYPARGQHHPWTVQYRSGNELGLEIILAPPRRSKQGQVLFTMTLKRIGGRWLIDDFQPAATFAPEGAAPRVTAQQDFMPAGQGEDGAAVEPKRLSADYIFIPFVVLALVLVAVAAWIVTSIVRERRMAGAHGRSLPPLPTRRSE